MKTIKACFAVIGGGSGGVAAALTAARTRPDSEVVLVERDGILGGTSTLGGVNNWEPGIGGMSGLHEEIAGRLLAIPQGAGTARNSHACTHEEPWGGSRPSPETPYEDSLQRSGLPKDAVARFHFEPLAMARVMDGLLRDAGVTVLTDTTLTDVQARDGRVLSVTCTTPADPVRIEADYFADCTADIVLCRLAGCETAAGEDPADLYGEPDAPPRATRRLNGATLVFRITPCERGYRDPVPRWAFNTDAPGWLASGRRPVCCVNDYPCGDANINMLPTLEGEDYWWSDPADRMHRSLARVLLYWNDLQRRYPVFDGYRLHSVFPRMGVRESYRLRGRSVLTANDLQAGFVRQSRREEIIAFGDHPVDVHGSRHRPITEIRIPYGIPFSALLPREYDNLIVACRGASFSHIAGAACRLSRTMLALGEAAGMATALLAPGGGYSDTRLPELRDRLRIAPTEDMIARRWKMQDQGGAP